MTVVTWHNERPASLLSKLSGIASLSPYPRPSPLQNLICTICRSGHWHSGMTSCTICSILAIPMHDRHEQNHFGHSSSMIYCLQCFDIVGLKSEMASGLDKSSDEALAWLCVWSKGQIVCLWFDRFRSAVPKPRHLLPHWNPEWFCHLVPT